MSLISDSDWLEYTNLINEVHSDFNQDIITLFKKDPKLNRYSEENIGYTKISLLGLIQYNIFRTWPMTKETTAGGLDEESIAVYFNNKYLSDNGYLTSNGNLDFDPGLDYFEFNGVRYRSAGETPVAQAKSLPLLTILILKRTPVNTGEDRY